MSGGGRAYLCRWQTVQGRVEYNSHLCFSLSLSLSRVCGGVVRRENNATLGMNSSENAKLLYFLPAVLLSLSLSLF